MKHWELADRVVVSLTWLVALIALCGISIVLVNGGGGDAQVWSGWVQALGSIAAIAGAFGVAAYQKSEANKREEISHRRNMAAEASLLESVAAEAYLEVSKLMLYCQKHSVRPIFAFPVEKLANVEFLLRSFVSSTKDPTLSFLAVGLLQDASDAMSTVNWSNGKAVSFSVESRQTHRSRTARVQRQFLAAQAIAARRNAEFASDDIESMIRDIASQRIGEFLRTIGDSISDEAERQQDAPDAPKSTNEVGKS